jgi:hypothetical protein
MMNSPICFKVAAGAAAAELTSSRGKKTKVVNLLIIAPLLIKPNIDSGERGSKIWRI